MKHLYSSMELCVQLSEEGEPQSIGSVVSNGLTVPTTCNDKWISSSRFLSILFAEVFFAYLLARPDETVYRVSAEW